MALVEEYTSETGCHVKIYDDYIKTDPAEIQKILDNIARIAAQPPQDTNMNEK